MRPMSRRSSAINQPPMASGNGTGEGHHELAIGARFPQPIGAVDDGLAQFRSHRAQVARSGGRRRQTEPPVSSRSQLRCETSDPLPSECEARRRTNDSKVVDEGRLERSEAVLREPDQRRAADLVCAAFRCERYAGRRCYQNEPGILRQA